MTNHHSFPSTTTFWHDTSIHCQHRRIVYSFLKDILLIAEHAVQNTHILYTAIPTPRALFVLYVLQSPDLWLCLSSIHQFPNMHTKMAKVISRMCVSTSIFVLSAESFYFQFPGLKGWREALRPNHRPASFRLTEHNKDSGGKWHLWTCCLTMAKMNGRPGLLVVLFLLLRHL